MQKHFLVFVAQLSFVVYGNLEVPHLRHLQMSRGAFEEKGMEKRMRDTLDFTLPDDEEPVLEEVVEKKRRFGNRAWNRRKEHGKRRFANLRQQESGDARPKPLRDLPLGQAAIMYPVLLANAMFPENIADGSPYAPTSDGVVRAPIVDTSQAGSLTGLSASQLQNGLAVAASDSLPKNGSSVGPSTVTNEEQELWRAPHLAAGFAGIDMLYWLSDILTDASTGPITELQQ